MILKARKVLTPGKSHETNTCGRCDDILHTGTQSRVHVHKLHEDVHDQYDPNLKTDENNI